MMGIKTIQAIALGLGLAVGGCSVDAGPKDIVVKRKASTRRPRIYDKLGFKKKVKYDFSGTRLASKYSLNGRLQRTLRWKPLYNAVERAYGIPKNTLGAMIMQESFGDPMQPNSGNDGGLGVSHAQGTTAKYYGLKIHGRSRRASDRRHGMQLKKMLEGCGYDPGCAQRYDERAHILKSIDLAGRIVAAGRKRKRSWDKGIMSYRGSRRSSTNQKYLRQVKRWRRALGSRRDYRRAEKDFNAKNTGSFGTYLRKFHATCENWGLSKYRKNL
ncbi:hypothetical protein ACFL0V_03155 [Nanoarchaeota archaeon]